MHFGDIIRQVAEGGAPIIVEQAGHPQAAVISLADLERLCKSLDGGICPPRQVARDEPDRESGTRNTIKSNGRDEFKHESRPE